MTVHHDCLLRVFLR